MRILTRAEDAEAAICEICFDRPFEPRECLENPTEYYEQFYTRNSNSELLIRTFNEFYEVKEDIDKLMAGVYSILILRGMIEASGIKGGPKDMVDPTLPPDWTKVANTATTIIETLGLDLVSYECENNGELYVHLSPQVGLEVSQDGMRGHTDGIVFPPNVPDRYHPQLPPGPDAVILIGIRNPNKVSTRVAPLSKVLRKLKSSHIHYLQRKMFRFKPQRSFSIPDTMEFFSEPVLERTEYGFRIRFSNSSITVMEGLDDSHECAEAFEALKGAVADSYCDICIEPGDIVLVNNNTAIHGRSFVGIPQDEETKRWILRTYGQRPRPEDYSHSVKKFMLRILEEV